MTPSPTSGAPQDFDIVKDLQSIVSFNRSMQPVGTVPMIVPTELADKAAQALLIAVEALKENDLCQGTADEIRRFMKKNSREALERIRSLSH